MINSFSHYMPNWKRSLPSERFFWFEYHIMHFFRSKVDIRHELPKIGAKLTVLLAIRKGSKFTPWMWAQIRRPRSVEPNSRITALVSWLRSDECSVTGLKHSDNLKSKLTTKSDIIVELDLAGEQSSSLHICCCSSVSSSLLITICFNTFNWFL